MGLSVPCQCMLCQGVLRLLFVATLCFYYRMCVCMLALCCACVCVCVCVHICVCLCNLLLPSTAPRTQPEAGVAPSTWPTAVYWCVATTLFFHATGHETTIPSIKFDAAFVGIHGEVNSLLTFLIAGLLVGLNTLASQVRGT